MLWSVVGAFKSVMLSDSPSYYIQINPPMTNSNKLLTPPMHVKLLMQYYAFDVATTLLFSSAENKLSPCFKA